MKPKSARARLQRSPAYRAPSDHTANSLRTAAAEFPTLSMVTACSASWLVPSAEEETRLSRCRSRRGLACPTLFLIGTRLSLTGYSCRKEAQHAAPSSETHNLFG